MTARDIHFWFYSKAAFLLPSFRQDSTTLPPASSSSSDPVKYFYSCNVSTSLLH